jgi:hypothetical protein
MIGGEAASRILAEVMRGVYESDADSAEERKYRQQIKKEVVEIEQQGGVVEMPRDWL